MAVLAWCRGVRACVCSASVIKSYPVGKSRAAVTAIEAQRWPPGPFARMYAGLPACQAVPVRFSRSYEMARLLGMGRFYLKSTQRVMQDPLYMFYYIKMSAT